jgi:predicted nucleotidyltransferase
MSNSLQSVTEKEIIRLAATIFYAIVDSSRYDLILFGSRATRTSHERSDYDFGILAKSGTNAPRLAFRDLLMIERVVKSLPALIDLVDFQAVSPEFREYALQHYIIIPKP